ncbi:MAG TPA: fucose isomerase [Spirochaetes bacterium]|nr:fucose isomerase [Spirochaetota bacterium]
MKHRVRIGVVCMARKTFDYRAAEDQYRRIRRELEKIENAVFVCVDELVIEVEDARKAALRLAAEDIDGLACISGTFHLGHLPLEIHKIVQKPLLLWGLPELPYDGGKIRLNSVCGVNLNASNLYKAGVRNYHVSIGEELDTDWVDALRVLRCFREARVGIAGSRAHGFFNLGIHELSAYREMGVLIDHYELAHIFTRPVLDEKVRDSLNKIESTFETGGVAAGQREQVAGLAAKLATFLDDEKLDALALRCWPEFAAEFGIAPCAAMSLLQSEGRVIACEGDIEGALSMMAHRALGAETPFLFDFSQINLEDDSALLWHCGVAPCNLWDGKCTRSLDTYFAGGKGVTADFVLKEGEVSILRIDSAGAEYRLFMEKAHGVAMEKELKGTYLKVKFDAPVREVLNTVVYNGIAHHASMVYGDYIRPLELLGRIKGWPVIR